MLGHDGRFNRLIHLVVSGASAQVPAQCASNLFVRWIGIHREQVFDRHDEARRAETALCTSPIAVSFLDRGQAAVFTHAFDGRDLLPFATGREHGAGKHRDAIHLHGARSAGRVVTATLGASKLQVQTQSVQQKRAGLECKLMGPAVDAEFDEFFFHWGAFGT